MGKTGFTKEVNEGVEDRFFAWDAVGSDEQKEEYTSSVRRSHPIQK